MFNNELSLGSKTYALTIQRPQSSVRKNAASSISVPNTLSIAHETAKSGQVSSVVYVNTDHLKSEADCTIKPVTSSVRAQFKLSYNPTVGLEDLEIELAAYRNELIAFLSDNSNWSKFLNQES